MRREIVFAGLGVAILCVATSSIFIRFSSAPALVIAFYRLLFTALLALALGQLRPLYRITRLSRPDLGLLVGAGIALALHFATWISSLNYTSVASSVLFTNLQVIFVTAIAWLFLKERISLPALIGIILALVGSAMIGSGDFRGGKMFGDVLALLSGLFIALALVIARRVRARIDLWSYTAAVSFTGALVLGTVNVIMAVPLLGYGFKEIMLFLLMALLPGIGGHGLFNWALRYVKAPIVSVAILGETIGASLLAWWLFNETLASYQLAGGLAVLTGLVLAIFGESKTNSTDIAS